MTMLLTFSKFDILYCLTRLYKICFATGSHSKALIFSSLQSEITTQQTDKFGSSQRH